MAAGHLSFHETKYERAVFFFFSIQMMILIRAILWEYDNGAEAINLDLKPSFLPSSTVK